MLRMTDLLTALEPFLFSLFVSVSLFAGSSYAGQALEGYSGTLPYGFGVMTTKDGFEVSGLFKVSSSSSKTSRAGEQATGLVTQRSDRDAPRSRLDPVLCVPACVRVVCKPGR